MGKGDKKSASSEVSTLETTINLHRRVKKIAFTKRAPRACTEIRKLAHRLMKTEDVRIDSNLNKHIWSQGITNPPKKIRVRLHRKRNEDEEAGNKLFTLVTLVNVADLSGLQTEVVDEDN